MHFVNRLKEITNGVISYPWKTRHSMNSWCRGSCTQEVEIEMTPFSLYDLVRIVDTMASLSAARSRFHGARLEVDNGSGAEKRESEWSY